MRLKFAFEASQSRRQSDGQKQTVTDVNDMYNALSRILQ